MELKGKVTEVSLDSGVSTLTVVAYCPDTRDGLVMADRTVTVSGIPIKFAEAYFVGREVRVEFSPVEK